MAFGDGALAPGFADPVHGAQHSFRLILDAMAHPGRIGELGPVLAAPPPAPLGAAAAAVLLTLCDRDTPLFLSPAAAAAGPYLRFHCGARATGAAGAARFALVAEPDDVPPLAGFDLGSDDYPDRSTTLLLQVRSLAQDGGIVLTGPGIAGRAAIAVAGPPSDFWRQRAALESLFPRGLDIILACGNQLAALPRSTIVERF